MNLDKRFEKLHRLWRPKLLNLERTLEWRVNVWLHTIENPDCDDFVPIFQQDAQTSSYQISDFQCIIQRHLHMVIHFDSSVSQPLNSRQHILIFVVTSNQLLLKTKKTKQGKVIVRLQNSKLRSYAEEETFRMKEAAVLSHITYCLRPSIGKISWTPAQWTNCTCTGQSTN